MQFKCLNIYILNYILNFKNYLFLYVIILIKTLKLKNLTVLIYENVLYNIYILIIKNSF